MQVGETPLRSPISPPRLLLGMAVFKCLVGEDRKWDLREDEERTNDRRRGVLGLLSRFWRRSVGNSQQTAAAGLYPAESNMGFWGQVTFVVAGGSYVVPSLAKVRSREE